MFLSTSNNEIGAHIRYEKNIYKTIMSAIDKGMYSLQFFMGNPKGFTRSQISQDDIDNSKRLIERFPMNVFSHAPYLFNLAGSKDILAWNGNKDQDQKTMNVIKNLEYELGIISNFTNKHNGVIVHPGNYAADPHKGLLTIAKSIDMINFTENSNLLLENSAGQGTSLCTTFKEIKVILDNINETSKKYVNVCLDTAHIFGYGEYDISKISEMIRMFNEFDKIIGIKHLHLIHLNDSVVKCKTRKDRHELIGEGYIWKDNNESLIYLLDFAKSNHIPIVLETDPSDMIKFT
tara:strand:- start:37 stop:909 length:873 start_codon:yes stop_codon:yes gene_type:complete